MKKSITILAAIASTSLISSLQADVFVLKDGTELEAEIISEKGDSYLLRVEVIKGIREEKTIKKSNVDKIVKSDPSLEDYEELKKLTPTPDLLKVEDYRRALDTMVAPFIEKYPKSLHISEVKEIQSTLEAEMKAIADGAIKLDGKMISPVERQMDLYDINARIQYSQISNLAKSRAFSSAMTTFETMERNYRYTKSFDKALELVESLLLAYKTQLEQMAAKADDAIKQRETALERMDHDDKLRTQRMFDAEEAKYQKALEEAKATRSRWLPINRYHKKEMKMVLRKIDSELDRISRLKEKETIDAGEAYRSVMVHLDKNEVELAKQSYNDFKRARPPREFEITLEEKIKTAEETMRQLEEEKRREAEEEARKAAEAAAEQAEKKAEDGEAKDVEKKN